MWRTTPGCSISASVALPPGAIVQRSSLPPVVSQLEARALRVPVRRGSRERGPVMGPFPSALEAGHLDPLDEALLQHEEEDQRREGRARRRGHDQVVVAAVLAA